SRRARSSASGLWRGHGCALSSGAERMDRARWQLVNRITADALEIDADLRAAFLDRECAGDPELRGEVDRILAAHPGFDRLLDGGVTEPAPLKDTGVRIVAPQPDTP